ncbi:hypothetical protein JCM8547_000837 [Rhodosporidiobolus lusitaniae]
MHSAMLLKRGRAGRVGADRAGRACGASSTHAAAYVHLLMAGPGSSGGGIDAANLLKPAMARGRIRVNAATTLNEFRKHIETDAAFERRMQQALVAEPASLCTALLPFLPSFFSD